jgi:hypothetical protein
MCRLGATACVARCQQSLFCTGPSKHVILPFSYPPLSTVCMAGSCGIMTARPAFTSIETCGLSQDAPTDHQTLQALRLF